MFFYRKVVLFAVLPKALHEFCRQSLHLKLDLRHSLHVTYGLS